MTLYRLLLLIAELQLLFVIFALVPRVPVQKRGPTVAVAIGVALTLTMVGLAHR